MLCPLMRNVSYVKAYLHSQTMYKMHIPPHSDRCKYHILTLKRIYNYLYILIHSMSLINHVKNNSNLFILFLKQNDKVFVYSLNVILYKETHTPLITPILNYNHSFKIIQHKFYYFILFLYLLLSHTYILSNLSSLLILV